jgi:hypothetical protein
MNSVLNRLNVIVMYAVMVLIILTLCSNLPLFVNYNPTPYIGLHNVQTLAYGRPSYPNPYSHIYLHTSPHSPSLLLKFDLDLDMRSCVTWGVKQLMVWVVVHYHTKSNAVATKTTFDTNQAVIWDSIIPFDSMSDEGNILIENLEASYPISELGGQIDFDKPFQFVVQWELTPMLGVFQVYKGKYVMKDILVAKK